MKILSVRFRLLFVGELSFRELFSCQMSRHFNERFLRKQFISTKTTSRNFLVKCACVALIGFHGKDEKHAKGLGE